MNYISEITELVSRCSESAQASLGLALDRLHGSDTWESFARLLLSQVLALTSDLVVYTLVIIPIIDPSLSLPIVTAGQIFVPMPSSLSSTPLVTACLSRCTVMALGVYRTVKSCWKAVPLFDIIVRIFRANFRSGRRKSLQTYSDETQGTVPEPNCSGEGADIPIISPASEGAQPLFDALNEATSDGKVDSITESENNTDLTATEESDASASTHVEEINDIELNDAGSVSDACYALDIQVSVERLDVRVEKKNETRSDLMAPLNLENLVPADTENRLIGLSLCEETVPAQVVGSEISDCKDPVEALSAKDEKVASLKSGEPRFEIVSNPTDIQPMSAVDCEEQKDLENPRGYASVAADASDFEFPVTATRPLCMPSMILEHLVDPASHEILPEESEISCIKSAPEIMETEKIVPETVLTQENTGVLVVHPRREGHEGPIRQHSSSGHIAANALNETTLQIDGFVVAQPPLRSSTLASPERLNNGLFALSSVGNRGDQLLPLESDQTNEISDGCYRSAPNAGRSLLECSSSTSALNTDVTSLPGMEAMQSVDPLKEARIFSCVSNLEVPFAMTLDKDGPLNTPPTLPMSADQPLVPNPVCSSSISDSEARDFPNGTLSTNENFVSNTAHGTLQRLASEVFKAPDAHHLLMFDHDKPDGKKKVPPTGSASTAVDGPPQSKGSQTSARPSTAPTPVNPFTSNIGLWASIHAPSSKTLAKGGLSKSLSASNTKQAGSMTSIYAPDNVTVGNPSRNKAGATRTASLMAPRRVIQSRSPGKKGLVDNSVGSMLSAAGIGAAKGVLSLESYSKITPSRPQNERKGRIHLGRPRTAPSAMPIN